MPCHTGSLDPYLSFTFTFEGFCSSYTLIQIRLHLFLSFKQPPDSSSFCWHAFWRNHISPSSTGDMKTLHSQPPSFISGICLFHILPYFSFGVVTVCFYSSRSFIFRGWEGTCHTWKQPSIQVGASPKLFTSQTHQLLLFNSFIPPLCLLCLQVPTNHFVCLWHMAPGLFVLLPQDPSAALDFPFFPSFLGYCAPNPGLHTPTPPVVCLLWEADFWRVVLFCYFGILLGLPHIFQPAHLQALPIWLRLSTAA